MNLSSERNQSMLMIGICSDADLAVLLNAYFNDADIGVVKNFYIGCIEFLDIVQKDRQITCLLYISYSEVQQTSLDLGSLLTIWLPCQLPNHNRPSFPHPGLPLHRR